MLPRVTPNSIILQNEAAAGARNLRIAELQRQLSSGLRVQRASHGPRLFRQALDRQGRIERLDGTLAQIEDTRGELNQRVAYLQESQKLFVRAKEIALDGRQTLEPTHREFLADELDLLLTQLKRIAVSTENGTEVFPGAKALLAGQKTRQSAQPASLPGVSLPSAEEVFATIDRSGTTLLGSTGLSLGSGTPTATGRLEITLTHTATTYAGGSGVQAGSSSPGGDTVLGPSGTHSLQVTDTSGTGAAGTVSLNGGPAVAFTSADTDLEVTGPAGEVVYVDLSSVTPGFSGTVDLDATGSVSADGGLTGVPFQFSDNLTVIDSRTGEAVHLDTQNVRGVGANSFEFHGTASAFELLENLRDDLRNDRDLPPGEWEQAIGRSIGEIDRVHSHLLDVVGEQSVYLKHLDGLQEQTEDIKLEVERQQGESLAADLPSVVVELQSEQNLLQFTLASTVRLFDTSLLNFLR